MIPRAAGSSISEYGLILALAAVAAIAGLTLLGSSLGDLLTGVGNQLPDGLAAAGNNTGNNGGGNNTGNGGNGGTGNNSPGNTTAGTQALSITLQDGTQIGLNQYPTDPVKTIQTTGASGTTQILAQQLQSLTDQLLAAGKISPQQASELQDLANLGHRMGKAEELIEKINAQCLAQPGWNCADTLPPGSDILSLQIRDYPDYIKSNPSVYTAYLMNDVALSLSPNQTINGQPSLATQLQLAYQESQGSGALSDPAVNQLVGNLVQQMTAMGEEVHKVSMHNQSVTVDWYTYQDDPTIWGGPVPTPPQYDVAAVVADQVAKSTHQASTSICSAGGGSDTGIHCR